MKTIYSTMQVKVGGKLQTLSALMAVGFDTQDTLASIYGSIAEGLHGHGVNPALLTAKGVRDTEREDGSKDDDFYRGITEESLKRYAEKHPESNAHAIVNMHPDNRNAEQAATAKHIQDAASKMRNGVREALIALIEGKKKRKARTARIEEHVIADRIQKEITKLQDLQGKKRRVTCGHTAAIKSLTDAYRTLSAAKAQK